MSKPKRIRSIDYKRLSIPRPSGDGPLTSGLRRKEPTQAIGFTHSFEVQADDVIEEMRMISSSRRMT